MKYYVVLKGRQNGIYTNRDECKYQVDGFLWAIYKSFTSEQAAQFARQKKTFWQSSWSGSKWQSSSNYLRQVIGSDFDLAICTDAACPSNPGPVEYRGVDIASGKELFSYGPLNGGSVNLAEFLAIVEGVRYLLCHSDDEGGRIQYTNKTAEFLIDWTLPSSGWQQIKKNILYSDSKIAIWRVQKGMYNTTILRNNINKELFSKLDEAVQWLAHHADWSQKIQLRKWPTDERGQIPADFWRK